MGLIAATGRRSAGVRLLLAGIVGLLTLGAVTMAVPFLLMLTGATRTGVDRNDLTLTPEFLWDDTALYRKFLEGLYNESDSNLDAAWRSGEINFSNATLLEKVDVNLVNRWRAFLEEYDPPPHEILAGFSYTPVSRGRPLNVRGFLRTTARAYDGDLMKANRALGTSFTRWNAFIVLPPDTRSRQGVHPDTDWWRAWEIYRDTRAPAWTVGLADLTGYYEERVADPSRARGGSPLPLTERAPDGEARDPWELFVRRVVHPGFVRIDSSATPAWQDFLRARYRSLDTFRKVTGQNVTDWKAIELPETFPERGSLRTDWQEWLQGWMETPDAPRREVPLTAIRLESADLVWAAREGRSPPRRQADQLLFQENKREIRLTFLFQNFAAVWELLIVHGRGLWVTAVYCLGSVVIALIVNPMAAYALSRFRPRHTYAFLLYLLLTMAFPPMVTQIPLFLMLRDFNLLNTFWALLLPGMAHGYSIFLLKGFFDSLPRELYESAALDGAGELRMFRVITLSLSTPILAVIALSAFVNAYTAFMFALLICQDERMWTLMVWLYQLQQTYGSGIMNAAFVLAALPTLVVFLFAQRWILRGIVVPSEK